MQSGGRVRVGIHTCTSDIRESVSTSGSLAAMLDFWERSTSVDVGSASIRDLDPENAGAAVRISTTNDL